eukprot:5870432-Amphidinium_carterae.1
MALLLAGWKIDCAGIFPQFVEMTSAVKKSASFQSQLHDFDHEGHRNYKSFDEAGKFALDEVDRIVDKEFGEVFDSWSK